MKSLVLSFCLILLLGFGLTAHAQTGGPYSLTWHSAGVSAATSSGGGYDLAMVRAVADAVPIPVIASGGGGTPESLAAALDDGPQGGHAQAALAASIFHFKEQTVASVKRRLLELGIPVRAPAQAS